METRTCTKCGETKPLSEFRKNKKAKTGYDGACSVCLRKAQKAWREANVERDRASSKAWVQRNPERAKENKRRWHEANRERQLELMREWKASNRERHRELSRKFVADNPEKVRAAKNQYWRKNRDKWRDDVQKRRARQRNAPEIETVNRKRVIERDKSICWLCGEFCPPDQLTLDHVIPLARGGSHTEANLKVAHRRCNAVKGAKIIA